MAGWGRGRGSGIGGGNTIPPSPFFFSCAAQSKGNNPCLKSYMTTRKLDGRNGICSYHGVRVVTRDDWLHGRVVPDRDEQLGRTAVSMCGTEIRTRPFLACATLTDILAKCRMDSLPSCGSDDLKSNFPFRISRTP